MPHELDWILENHVLQGKYWGDISVEEIESSIQELISMLDKIDQPLMHSIIDIAGIEHIPVQIFALKNLTNQLYKHPKLGWTIVYGNKDSFLAFSANIISQLFKSRFRQLDTHQEAVQFLSSVDETFAKNYKPLS